MFETIWATIPVEYRGPSIFSLMLIIGIYIYLDYKHKIILRELTELKCEHKELRKEYEGAESALSDIVNELSKNLAEVNISLKSMVVSQTDIKQDIRDMRNKTLK